MNPPKVDPEKIQALIGGVIKLFNERHVDAYVNLHPCDCGAVTLVLDLSGVPKHPTLAKRLCRKFAKCNSLFFSPDPGSGCVNCSKPRAMGLVREITVGAKGIKRDEFTVVGDILHR